MKLYFTKGACSLAIRILINELNLKSDYEEVDLQTKKTATQADFLKINPKGAVPVLKLDNGEYLTENAVIQQYLAEKFAAKTLLPPPPDINRYRILEYSNFITTDLHKSFGSLFNPNIPQDIKDQVFIPLIKHKFNFINDELKQPYLMGESFRLPDAYLFVMLLWAQKFKLDLGDLKPLSDYYKRLQKRPSIEKSLTEEGIRLS